MCVFLFEDTSVFLVSKGNQKENRSHSGRRDHAEQRNLGRANAPLHLCFDTFENASVGQWVLPRSGGFLVVCLQTQSNRGDTEWGNSHVVKKWRLPFAFLASLHPPYPYGPCVPFSVSFGENREEGLMKVSQASRKTIFLLKGTFDSSIASCLAAGLDLLGTWVHDETKIIRRIVPSTFTQLHKWL